jgi:AhpD family alkylhydroperoxidase
MSYLPALPRTAVDAATGAKLDAVQSQLGVLPNMFRTFANAPVALDAYLQLAQLAGKSRLDAKLRERLALAVGQANGCDYCVSAHLAIGGLVGLTPAQTAQARVAQAENPRDAAALLLARRIVETRGHVPTAELDAFKAAGWDDGAILEVLLVVTLNVFTNYTNHLARTELDFPAAEALAA